MRRSVPPALVVALCLALVSCAPPDGGSRGAAAAAGGDGDAALKATATTTATVGTRRASCPVTRPPQPPFVPPKPYRATPPLYGGLWYGSDQLWTLLQADGTWEMARDKDGLFDKSFWWRAGFDPRREQTPKLTLTARRLDLPEREIAVSSGTATNGWCDDDDIGAFMLTGIALPTAGCWEITGHYRTGELSFVVWVT